jgi:hypothetical protein
VYRESGSRAGGETKFASKLGTALAMCALPNLEGKQNKIASVKMVSKVGNKVKGSKQAQCLLIEGLIQHSKGDSGSSFSGFRECARLVSAYAMSYASLIQCKLEIRF